MTLHNIGTDRTQDRAARHRHKTRISSTISARGAESLAQWAARHGRGGDIQQEWGTALQLELQTKVREDFTITEKQWRHLL